jgi:hypothetical protein
VAVDKVSTLIYVKVLRVWFVSLHTNTQFTVQIILKFMYIHVGLLHVIFNESELQRPGANGRK